MSSAGRFGFKCDNLFSIGKMREGLRLRRLVGPPFGKKFLLEQEQVFKDCTKRMMERINELRILNDNKVDLLLEGKNYAMDVVSILLDRDDKAEFYSGIFVRRVL